MLQACEARLSRVLLVEDDEALGKSIVDLLSTRAEQVRSCTSIRDAREIIHNWKPTLLIFDFMLPDGNTIDLLQELSQYSPIASTIAISAFANPEQSFQFGNLGVRAYLQKPFGLKEFNKAVDLAISTAPNTTQNIRGSVGHISLKDMEKQVRTIMVDEAMNLSNKNLHIASKILLVSRQFLQHVLRKIHNAD